VKQKIDVQDLRIGMYITDIDRPWLDSPFLFQGFPVESQRDIDWIQRTCKYVYIDEEGYRDLTPREASNIAPERHTATEEAIQKLAKKLPYKNKASFEEEFKSARDVHSKAKSYMETVLEDVRLGKSIDAEGAKDVVKNLVDSITRNPDTGLWFTRLRKKDEYTADHSLNVCILTLIFGRYLNFSETVLNELGVGALLHDIGKMRVPLDILNKPGSLTDEQLALIKQHPTFGAEILKTTPGIPGSAVDIAYCHHERASGNGYPCGLRANDMTLFSKMVSIVDVYDAITSNRVYHHGMSPSDALRNMYGWQHKDFDESLVEDFIQCLGIYPVGSVVQLGTGDIGIIMSNDKNHRLKPTILLVLNEEKVPFPQSKIINLALFDGIDANKYVIKKVFGPDEFPIDLNQYLAADLPEVFVV
jgi:HD-GYP domain-containing protein (c-di-GMP phosphodiesterase class II)